MLPVTHLETSEEASRRHSNFITLRTIEGMVTQDLFKQILQQAQANVDFPRRIDWQGQSKALSFDEVKLNFTQIDQNYLPQLLQSRQEASSNQDLKLISSQNLKSNTFQKSLTHSWLTKNLYFQRKNLHLAKFAVDPLKNLKNQEISRFERMKTVFGHAQIEEGYNAPIYNVIFDQTGSFIFSGADDGHNDFITDMDISKCNRYLATASKDGKVIIWDWKECQKIDEIQAHTSTISNIKFFQVKNKSSQQKDPIQILVSCSEDGTAKIYDESIFGIHNNNLVIEHLPRRSRRQDQPAIQRKERYIVTLTPDDFRPGPGQRNKKLESINVNQNGLVAAGTHTGEVFLWQLEVGKMKNQNPKPYVWLGQSKKHTKSVHFCEFSPSGKQLMTGSTDGTLKIWKTETEKTKKGQESLLGLTDDRLLGSLEEKRIFNKIDGQIFFRNVSFFNLILQKSGEQVSLADHKHQKNNWSVDSCCWSCKGRYAIASMSGKVDLEDRNLEWSTIKIWDSFTEETIEDIAKLNGLQLMNYSFVTAAHPHIEEIFLSGSDGGIVCLWNIKTRKLIKKFLEYGVYSYEKYTMNNPFDGRFSPDGTSFVVGSELGTISLFSKDKAKFKYEATRVEQFFPQDDQKHMFNIYYDMDEEPMVCSYNLIPHGAQPPQARIGKFSNTRPWSNEEYERNYITRREIGIEEETFLQAQLEEGQRNDLFNGQFAEPLIGQQYEEEKELFPRNGFAGRPRINSQVSQIQHAPSNIQGSQEEAFMLNQMNQRANERRGRGRPRLNRNNQAMRQQQQLLAQQMRQVRINPNIDPDNSAYDRVSDENFEEPGGETEEFDEEDLSSEGSSAPSEYPGRNYSRREASERRNENQSANRNRNNAPGNTRTDRALRRQTRLYGADEDEGELRGTRSKRKAVINSNDGSMNDFNDDDDYAMSGDEMPKRKLTRNNYKEVSSESEDSNDSVIRTRNAARNKKAPPKQENKKLTSRRDNLRNRENRKRYNDMDSSSEEQFEDSDSDEDKIQSNQRKRGSQEKNKSVPKNKRVIQDESDTEMVDQDVIVPVDNKKQKGDEDFELLCVNQNNIQLDVDMMQNNACSFCNRIDHPLLGPFIRVANVPKGKQDEKYYFHKDCIEVNNHSFFNQQKQKWMNIGKALDVLKQNNCMCSRCNKKGATIKCTSCRKMYHGHLCSSLYMIYTGGQSYQCFACRNKENYITMNGRDMLEKTEFKAFKRSMVRQHLLNFKQSRTQYVPQINDMVYYFFQGHEKFISYYNCFFYAGDEKEINFSYPWQMYPILENPTLCKIKSIKHSFPSKNSLYLLKRYGKSSQIEQKPQIITHLELYIADQPDSTFDLEIFPNDLPDFLVLQNLYEQSLMQLEILKQDNKVINQQFKARLKHYNQVKVVGIQEREPTVYPTTGWENILCRHIESYRLRDRGGRRRDNEDLDPPDAMNFWELVLDNQTQASDEMMTSTIFTDSEINDIIVHIQDYCSVKKDQTAPFQDRVPEEIAKDYRDHVVGEMYLNLINQRLTNGYYRSYEQFFADLEQIHLNAKLYNGEDHPLTKDSKKLSDFVKNETKKIINYFEDSKRRRFEENKNQVFNQKPSGKLTAPIIKSSVMDYSSMEQFRNSIKKPQDPMEELKELMQRDLKQSKVPQEMIQPASDFSVRISNHQHNDDSEPKITPKMTTATSYERKSSRSNVIQIRNDNYYSTGEKSSSKPKLEEEVGLLGKRTTRSGRVTRQMKSTLNEDELYREFDRAIEDAKSETKEMIQPYSSSKRVRQN